MDHNNIKTDEILFHKKKEKGLGFSSSHIRKIIINETVLNNHFLALYKENDKYIPKLNIFIINNNLSCYIR